MSALHKASFFEVIVQHQVRGEGQHMTPGRHITSSARARFIDSFAQLRKRTGAYKRQLLSLR
jgi:hypothetical protein